MVTVPRESSRSTVRTGPPSRSSSNADDPAVAMAYLAANHAIAHHEVYADVRGKRQPMRVAPMPFTPHRYHRG